MAYRRVCGAATAKGHEHVRVTRRQDPPGDKLSRYRRADGVHFEAEVFDHLPGLGRGHARRREVAADKERVGGIERQRLQRAQVELATARDAQLRPWVQEADQTEYF